MLPVGDSDGHIHCGQQDGLGGGDNLKGNHEAFELKIMSSLQQCTYKVPDVLEVAIVGEDPPRLLGCCCFIPREGGR